MALDKSLFGISNGFMANVSSACSQDADGSDAPAVTQAALEFAAPAPLEIAAAAPVMVDAPGAAGTLQTLANYLTTGFWDDFANQDPRWYNLGNSGTGANFGAIFYNVSGYWGDANGISAARQVMVREAFKLYGEVLGITFIETTSTADHVDYFFQDNVFTNTGGERAYCSTVLHSGSGGAIDYNVVNVTPGWSGGTSNIGGTSGYTFQTFLHEIGHGLGLGHQGNYNAGSGTPTYANSAIWANDSWQQTMMSYWSQTANTSILASFAHLISPMAVDWIALNDLYAWQGFGTGNAFNGNTIYGFGTNITTGVSEAYANIAALADTNAFCIVDGSGTDTVDFSGYWQNQTIDLREPSSGSTTGSISSVGGLTGNMTIAVGTVIENANSGSGHDVIYGNSVANVINPGAGNDWVAAGSGNDRVDDLPGPGGGNDVFYGEAGGDTLWGHTGNDWMSGGTEDDFLGGEADNDTLWGGTGEDTTSGGAGNDSIYDDDAVSFDEHDGGSGIDWIDYSSVTFSSGVVSIDLQAGLTSVNFVGGNTETIINFENARGSQGGETISGTTGVNILGGQGGNDFVFGNAGNDQVYGDAGNDTVQGGDGNDTVRGGDGDDTVQGGGHKDAVFGDAGNDWLEGNADSDRLTGDDGKDTLLGLGNATTGKIRGDIFDFNSVSDSEASLADCDVIQGFDLAGAGNGDRIELRGLGVVWGDLSFANVAGNTRCMIDVSGGAAAEMWIQINDGAVGAAAYTAADFIF